MVFRQVITPNGARARHTQGVNHHDSSNTDARGDSEQRIDAATVRETQHLTNEALKVGTDILRALLSGAPAGEDSLQIIDAGPDRTYEFSRDDAGAHVPASPAALQAEAALVGAPIAFGSGAVTLLLHSGPTGAVNLRGWRVMPDGVVNLSAHELKREFGPDIFDRHRGLSYLDAYPLS